MFLLPIPLLNGRINSNKIAVGDISPDLREGDYRDDPKYLKIRVRAENAFYFILPGDRILQFFSDHIH